MKKTLEFGSYLNYHLDNSKQNEAKTENLKSSAHNILPCAEEVPAYYKRNKFTAGPQRGKDKALVKLADLPESRHLPSNFTYLNRIQEDLYNHIFDTEKDLFLAMPLGSGKKAIFEMCCLKFLENSKLFDTNVTKLAIYLAPDGATCHRLLTSWRAKFSALSNDLTVEGLNFLNEPAGERFTSNRVKFCFTTPEEIDSMSFNFKDGCEHLSLGLLCIDGTSMLNDSKKGPQLESFIAKLKHRNKKRGANLRVVLVSLPTHSFTAVARWLQEERRAYITKEYDSPYANLPVKVDVKGYFQGSMVDFVFDRSLNKFLKKQIKQNNTGRALVFCNTRASAIEASEALCESDPQFSITAEQQSAIQNLTNRVTDSTNKRLIERGICVLHSSINNVEFHAIEQSFIEGALKVLFTTNLGLSSSVHANLVIIKSTQRYSSFGYTSYTELEMDRMIGHAIKDPKEPSKALIMTSQGSLQHWQKYTSGATFINSNFESQAVNLLNREIASGRISSREEAMEWLEGTYFWSCERYKRFEGAAFAIACRDELNSYIDNLFNHLHDLELTKHVGEGCDKVMATKFASAIAEKSISFSTARHFIQQNWGAIESSATATEIQRKLLAVISECDEFLDYAPRRQEKKALREASKSLTVLGDSAKPLSAIATYKDKTLVLLYSVMCRYDFEELALQSQKHVVAETALKLSESLQEYLLEKGFHRSYCHLTKVSRALQKKISLGNENQLMQLLGMTRKLSETFQQHGIGTLDALAYCESPSVLQSLSSAARKQYETWKRQCQEIPRYAITHQCHEGQTTVVLNRIPCDATKSSGNEESFEHIQHELLVCSQDGRVLFLRELTAPARDQHGSALTFTFESGGHSKFHCHLICKEYCGLDMYLLLNLHPASTTVPRKFPQTKATFTTNSKRASPTLDSWIIKIAKENDPKRRKFSNTVVGARQAVTIL